MIAIVARALGIEQSGVPIVWIGLLVTVALFREMAHHCTAYDEERSIMRARVVRR